MTPRAATMVLLLALACSGGKRRVEIVTGAPRPGRDTAAARLIDPIVDHLSFRNAQWGILVVDVAGGDTVYARNPASLLVPASNLKLITGAVALKILGPDFRFTTVVSSTGPIRQGVLEGDLVILGSGDPTFSARFHGDPMRPLRAIADSLGRRGVRRVSGRLVSGFDAFPDAGLARGWAWDDLDQAYAATVDELLLNEGVTRVSVRGGAAPGQPVEVRTSPARAFPPVRNSARTVSAGEPQVWVVWDSLSGGLSLGGTIAARSTVELEVTNRNQTAAYLEALREALADRGIAVGAGVLSRPLGGSSGGLGSGPTAEARARPPTGPGRTALFAITSPPLSAILTAFEKNSVNQIGEALLKTVGRLRSGVGTFESGIDAIRRQLGAWGVASDGFIIRDGSGLSRMNAVSAETLVRVLVRIREEPAFATFAAALPVAGLDGTLGRRLGGAPARGNVRAKTGSMEQVRALSGYVTAADGRQLAFSVLANNWTVPASQVESAIDDIVLRLARLRRTAR